jgi:CheY-like chemotaxis protein
VPGGSVSPIVEDSKATRPLRVLCIDDEPMVRNVLVELLQIEGHEANAADGGEVGLQLFRDARHCGRPYDIVISDLGMPHMDGRELAQIVKRESPETPVILLTGWGRIMKDDNDHPTEVDLVLSKPPRPSDVRQALQRLVEK